MKKNVLFALAILMSSCIFNPEKGELIEVAASNDQGFHYPYFLFIPDDMSPAQPVRMIVEPNNSGFASDNFDEHLEKASRTASNEYYLGSYLAQQLNYPLLVPVFPRPKENWKIYTHSLDRDVMNQKGTDLERIDLQLLAMVEDAKQKLAERGFELHDRFFLTGFSASGTFANRFTLIHPEKVAAVAAGGLNGLLMLPVDSLKNNPMNYPLGTNDFENRFGKPFDFSSFQQTPQFWFMGALDDNDAIPYADGYDEDERALIYEVLGEEMQPLRWKNCSTVYAERNIRATIKTFPEIGHKHPELVKNELLEFFQAADQQ